MFFEILSSAMLGSIAIVAQLKKSGATNDSDKLNKIFSLTGLNLKDKEKTYTAQLLKKRNYSWGTEYCYRIPLGRSFEDYQAKFNHIQDGLNNKKTDFNFSLSDLKALDFKGNIIKQIHDLLNKKKATKKEIELSYDGTLKVMVYNTPLPTMISYTDIPLSWDGWKVPVGQIREGNALILHDFEKAPHMALGGTTRYGKSNFLNMLITTLIILQPDNVRFTLIDLKGGVEFSDYREVKQVINYAEEPEEAEEALKAVVEEMRTKQRTLKNKGAKKVQEANDPIRHFVIVDEVGELNPAEAVTKEEKELRRRCQSYMSQIARLGAGLGYRQILATQYPTGDCIPRACKQNSDAKICFRVQNDTASHVVLDESGAEQLPEIVGRAIYQAAAKKQIIQTPLIEGSTIQQVIKPHLVIKPRKEQGNDDDSRQESGKAGADPAQSGAIRFHE